MTAGQRAPTSHAAKGTNNSVSSCPALGKLKRIGTTTSAAEAPSS